MSVGLPPACRNARTMLSKGKPDSAHGLRKKRTAGWSEFSIQRMRTFSGSSSRFGVLAVQCDLNHINFRDLAWRSPMKNARYSLLMLAVAGLMLTGGMAMAQGCVAAHSNQRVLDELLTTNTGGEVSPFWLHNLTVDIGYRVFNSNKYFQGSTEIAR